MSVPTTRLDVPAMFVIAADACNKSRYRSLRFRFRNEISRSMLDEV
jgi:hypothetical protein